MTGKHSTAPLRSAPLPTKPRTSSPHTFIIIHWHNCTLHHARHAPPKHAASSRLPKAPGHAPGRRLRAHPVQGRSSPHRTTSTRSPFGPVPLVDHPTATVTYRGSHIAQPTRQRLPPGVVPGRRGRHHDVRLLAPRHRNQRVEVCFAPHVPVLRVYPYPVPLHSTWRSCDKACGVAESLEC